MNGAGGSSLPVKTGNYSVTALDIRFNGADVSGNTIDLGPDNTTYVENQEVIYDNGGGTTIGGLHDANEDMA